MAFGVPRDAAGGDAFVGVLHRVPGGPGKRDDPLVHAGRRGSRHCRWALEFPPSFPRPEVIMANRKVLGWTLPAVVAAVMLTVLFFVLPSGAVWRGLLVGVAIALAQSYASIFALARSLRTPRFFWVWGGAFGARLLVFAVTAFIAYRLPALHLVSTMVSLVIATMLFMVVESFVLLGK